MTLLQTTSPCLHLVLLPIFLAGFSSTIDVAQWHEPADTFNLPEPGKQKHFFTLDKYRNLEIQSLRGKKGNMFNDSNNHPNPVGKISTTVIQMIVSPTANDKNKCIDDHQWIYRSPPSLLPFLYPLKNSIKITHQIP